MLILFIYNSIPKRISLHSKFYSYWSTSFSSNQNHLFWQATNRNIPMYNGSHFPFSGLQIIIFIFLKEIIFGISNNYSGVLPCVILPTNLGRAHFYQKVTLSYYSNLPRLTPKSGLSLDKGYLATCLDSKPLSIWVLLNL